MTSSSHAGVSVGSGQQERERTLGYGCPNVWLQGPHSFICFVASNYLEMTWWCVPHVIAICHMFLGVPISAHATCICLEVTEQWKRNPHKMPSPITRSLGGRTILGAQWCYQRPSFLLTFHSAMLIIFLQVSLLRSLTLTPRAPGILWKKQQYPTAEGGTFIYNFLLENWRNDFSRSP